MSMCSRNPAVRKGWFLIRLHIPRKKKSFLLIDESTILVLTPSWLIIQCGDCLCFCLHLFGSLIPESRVREPKASSLWKDSVSYIGFICRRKVTTPRGEVGRIKLITDSIRNLESLFFSNKPQASLRYGNKVFCRISHE